MNGAIKFVIGAAATSLLAVGAHGTLGLGADFIDTLESRATSSLGDAGGVGVSLTFVREPALHRVAILSGTADAATRARLIAVIRSVPGVRDARWADGGTGAEQGE